ncbi:hypothetical protein ACWFPY_05895 [Nocardia fluminea]
MSDRTELRATLLVDPGNDVAYPAYKSWGWSKVGTLTPSWPNSPTFDVLVKELRDDPDDTEQGAS